MARRGDEEAPLTPPLVRSKSIGLEAPHVYGHPAPAIEPDPAAAAESSDERTVYIMMIVMGAACLLPWKSFITAVDYYQARFPGRNAEFYFALVYNGPLICGLAVLNVWGRLWDLRRRIFTALFCMVACVSMVFVLDYQMERGALTEAQGFHWTLFIVFLSGAATSVLQGSLYGLAGLFGEHHTQALQFGKGWAGIAVVACRLGTKALPSFTVRESTLIYFGLADAVLACGFFLFVALLQMRFVQDRLRAGAARYEPAQKASYGSVQAEDSEDAEGEHGHASVAAVFRIIAVPVLCVFVTFVVCIGLFPGMTTSLQSTTYELGDWYPLLTIALFDLGDLIGKALPAHKQIFTADTIWLPTLLHGGFIPVFIVAVRDTDSWFFGSDNFQFLIVLALGISTGYIGCSAMMIAPQMVPDHQKEAAGQLETFFLVGGLFMGSVLGVVLSEVALPDHVVV